MAKFYGLIGFTTQVETHPDVWEPIENALPYRGDILRNQRKWTNGESVNEDLDISNEISIVADDFMTENLGAMKWVELMGTKWKITSISLDYPRVTLSLGGVYNGG